MPLIEARNVTIRIPTEDGILHAANDISFCVEAGELFGIAGESGSGKSVLIQAITGLLPGVEIEGEVLFEGQDLLAMSQKQLRAIRGARIGMIFQDPLSSLHPYYTIGSQITEMIFAHNKVGRAEARRQAVDMLARVGIEDAGRRFDDFPHQFSGGMRQRVMIAMALVLRPPLIIADEPTTALDVTVQTQIVNLLDEMRRELGTTVIVITHDLGLLSNIADDVMIMYAGTRLEIGPSAGLFTTPTHPYTLGLLRSSPAGEGSGDLVPIAGKPPSLLVRTPGCVFAARCPQARPDCSIARPPLRIYDDGSEALCAYPTNLSPPPAEAGSHTYNPEAGIVVEGRGITLTYSVRRAFSRSHELDVLKGVDVTIRKGETLGLVGESGCGKSTLARVLAGLLPATSGAVTFEGEDMEHLSPARWRQMRRRVQLVFQDPFGSLNPRRRVGSIIGDPFRIHNVASGAERKAKVQEMMELVGLNPEHFNRFPSEFSGGQRQRIGIARALALKPSLIILDEPVSALDVSIQAQILNLMRKLQKEMDLTYLFISHDLSVVRHICDRIAVMDAGKIVEEAETEALYASPQHPFTRKLLNATQHPPALKQTETRKLIETRLENAA